MEAKDLIQQAGRIAKRQGITRARWSNVAGRSVHGQTVYRIMTKGDCKLSTFLELLEPLGYKLVISRKEEEA